jgi:predicted MFS family arabinose efflux permease
MSLARSTTIAARFPLARLIGGLGVGQIVGWGSSFYLPTIFAGDMAHDTGLSEEVIFAGVTVMLLVRATLAPSLGRWLDRGGARAIMTIGSVVLALSLCLIALSSGLVSYLFGWAVMGISGAMLLTNSCFVAVAQRAGAGARRAMTVLMLFTGSASSFAWPALGFLQAELGWRSTCFLLAGVQLVLCAPLHWWLLETKPERAATTASASFSSEGIAKARQRIAMLVLVPSMCLSGFISWGLSVHIVELLRHIGAEHAEAIWLASLLGVLQVSGRLIDLAMGSRHSPVITGMVASALLSAAFGVALAFSSTGSPAFAFMIIYGLGSGSMSLARVMMPLALFGSRNYGRASGILAGFQNVAFASAPLVYAVLFERAGTSAVLWLSFAAGVMAFLGLAALDALRRSSAP